MQLTAFGLLSLPLCLACLLSPELMLCLVVYTGGFEAAATVVVGPFGVQPNVVPALLFMGQLLLLRLLGTRFGAHAEITRAMTPLLLFAACVLAGAFVLPHVFAGDVVVWPQKSDDRLQTRLDFTLSNVTQSAYMLLDVGMAYATAVFAGSCRLRVRRVVAAYFGCGLLVTGVAVWQFASRVAGVPFPDGLFFSNPGWVVYSGQAIGSVPRTNGPFSEPAALAAFLSGTLYAAAWVVLHGGGTRLARWTLAASALGMVLSTATTGFVLLLGGLGLLCVYVPARASPAVARRFAAVALPAVLAITLLGALVSVLVPDVASSVADVVVQTLAKPDSQSFEERTQADGDSVALLLPTLGLGAGWGSNRSSSLIPGLLGNAGLPGLALALWTLLRLRRELRVMRRFVADEDDQWALQAIAAGLVGFLLASVVAGPTITSLTFFTLLGLCYGILARARLATEARRQGALDAMRGRALSGA